MEATATIEQLEAQIRALKDRLDEAHVGQHLAAAAAAAAGVRPDAILDAVDRVLRSGRRWKLDDDGVFVRLREDGFPDLDEHANRVTPRRAVESIRGEASYYWSTDAQPAADSAHPATGNLPADLSGIENPWLKFNLTRQAQTYEKDRELAQRLADAAGVPVLPGAPIQKLR
jgi:hypothetical protein